MNRSVAKRRLMQLATGAAVAALCAAGGGAPFEAPAVEPPQPPNVGIQTISEEFPHLHNLLLAGGNIYAGGEPKVEAAFAELARLGVKTVVSVDGARPNARAARRHGLRYVHIPIGYDGISQRAGQSLYRLVREADGPFYIHCHHGKHRGPAAAAAACVAAGATDGKGALDVLRRAGTSKSYAGLWRDAAGYEPPSANVKLPPLVETARIESLAAAMAKLDRSYDNLKLCREAAWTAPPHQPDFSAAQEALLLKEGLREAARNLAGDFGAGFRAALTEAESLAANLQTAIEHGDLDAAGRLLVLIDNSCKRCHQKQRN